MTLNQLNYFISVVNNGSFTKAAQELFISQPTLSHSISSLEAELKVKLITREHHLLTMTSAGRKLYDYAVQIRSLINEIYNDVGPEALFEVPSLKIGFMSDLLAICFPEIVAPFLHENAKIHVQIDQNHVLALHEKLQRDKLDIIFTRSSSLIDMPIKDSESLTITKDRFCLVVHVNHWAAKYDELTDLSILKDESLITMSPEYTSPLVGKLVQMCEDRNLHPKMSFCNGMMDAMLAQVASGQGYTITPESYVHYRNYPSIKIISLGDYDDLDNDLCICWKKNNQNPNLEIFIKYVKRVKDIIGIKAK